jgi:endonuclease YncB( thermonuclease family)
MFHLRHVTLGSLLAATGLSFSLLPASAFACELSEPQKGTVAEVKDGETLALTNGTVVRLVNAKAPTAPIAAQGDRPWPMVNEAKEALSKLPQAPRSSFAMAAPAPIATATRSRKSMW